MVDFHTHILPRMDDGSSCSAESVNMLQSYSDRVDTVILTPHFYPFEEAPEVFLERREASKRRLDEVLAEKGINQPNLLVGAEVCYYEGIRSCGSLEKFTVTGTRLLLVEMPMKKWTKRMIDELLKLKSDYGMIPVLAHLNRYMFGSDAPASGEMIEYYLENGGLVQINAESIISHKTRNKILRLFKNGAAHFLGSDAHNTDVRKQNYDEALDILNRHHASITEIIKNNENTFIKLN